MLNAIAGAICSSARMKYIPLAFCLVVGGLLIFAIGSYCGHSLPYPDPTPELLTVQRRQLFTAKIEAIVAFVLIIVGVISGFIPKRASTLPE